MVHTCTSNGSTLSATMDTGCRNAPVLDTILVTGNVASIGKEALKLYFNNKRKCGGEGVVSIVMQQDKAFITFRDIQGKQYIIS